MINNAIDSISDNGRLTSTDKSKLTKTIKIKHNILLFNEPK
jgi:hypothetical protein